MPLAFQLAFLAAWSAVLSAQVAPTPVPPQGMVESSFTSGMTNFVIAFTGFVTACGVVWANVILARAKARVIEASVRVEAKADEIGKDTKTTLGHVNSAATEMRAMIAALQQENKLLRQTGSDDRQIAAVLAATHAAQAPRPSRAGDFSGPPAGASPAHVAAVAVTEAVVETLDKIEVHTADTAAAAAETAVSAAETAKNTAKE